MFLNKKLIKINSRILGNRKFISAASKKNELTTIGRRIWPFLSYTLWQNRLHNIWKKKSLFFIWQSYFCSLKNESVLNRVSLDDNVARHCLFPNIVFFKKHLCSCFILFTKPLSKSDESVCLYNIWVRVEGERERERERYLVYD